MPTYEYECRGCGHAFELFQQMSDPVKRKCPECRKLSLKRLIGTGSGVIFKGGGFYETDYRSDSYKKAADADQKAADPKKTEKTSKTEAGKSGGTDRKVAKSGEKKSGPSKSASTTPRSGGDSKQA